MAGSRVLNLERLHRKLKALPDAMSREVRAAMEQAAEDIVALAKSLVPERDGNLKHSIGWTWGEVPRGAISLGKVLRSQTAKQMSITVFAGDDTAFYARWVEFGTAPHSLAKGADVSSHKRQRGRSQHPGAKAQPFFFPAYRANKKPAVRTIRKAARQAAKKVAAGS